MDLIYSLDARTGEHLGDPIPATDPASVDAVVSAARHAAPQWAARSAQARASALEAAAEALAANAAELVRLADAETALGETRLRGEVDRTCHQLRMFADWVREGSYVDALLSPADRATQSPDLRRMLTPVGPVAVFAASNFPFAFSVAGGDTASALAVGCPVVLKAHEGHLRTSLRTAEVVAAALTAAGAPDGVFGLVSGMDAGRRLVLHPGVRAVGFTGSRAGGRALHDLATSRPDPIPFYGELGSVNPVVVLPGAARTAPRDLAAGYAASLTLGAGQLCTNPGLLFAPDVPELFDAIRDAVSSSTAGTMLNRRIYDGFVTETHEPRWLRQRLHAQGSTTGPFAGVPEVRHTRIENFVLDIDHLAAERFGPAGLLVTYDDLDELIAALAVVPGSLATAIHAAEDEYADAARVAEALRGATGRLIMNGWPTGVAVRWAMHHGGPWPATTSAAHTSVGATAVRRWLVPVVYQDWPDSLLSPELQDDNPLNIPRVTQRPTSSNE